MVWIMTNPTGLRERKKAATRTALSQAAMRLAIECGLENVTSDAIAEAVDVSPRTFHNYFASKEEALLTAFREYTQAIAASMLARPAGEPIWDTLQHVATAQILSPMYADAALTKMRLIDSSPAMLTSSVALCEELEQVFAEIVAARTGTDAAVDLYPNLLSAAALAAITTALKLWTRSDGTANLPDLLADAFAQVRAGVPEPAARATS
jgi:AcrR family transcriptional regulator